MPVKNKPLLSLFYNYLMTCKDKVVTVDTMKAHREVTVHPHSLLILALGEWSTSCPGQFIPRKIDPSIHFFFHLIVNPTE